VETHVGHILEKLGLLPASPRGARLSPLDMKAGGPGEAVITSTNIRTKGFPWRTARPLVFINGCHTTALEPRRALELVSAFVVDAFASGVIGTEISGVGPAKLERHADEVLAVVAAG